MTKQHLEAPFAPLGKEDSNENSAKPYTINIFIEGYAGTFKYSVGTREQAMTHFAAITSTGYRRIDDRGNFVWYSPHLIRSIKISGPGLETQYPDEFVRT